MPGPRPFPIPISQRQWGREKSGRAVWPEPACLHGCKGERQWLPQPYPVPGRFFRVPAAAAGKGGAKGREAVATLPSGVWGGRGVSADFAAHRGAKSGDVRSWTHNCQNARHCEQKVRPVQDSFPDRLLRDASTASISGLALKSLIRLAEGRSLPAFGNPGIRSFVLAARVGRYSGAKLPELPVPRYKIAER